MQTVFSLTLTITALKHDGKWLSNNICQLPQHSWVHPIRAPGFVGVQFV